MAEIVYPSAKPSSVQVPIAPPPSASAPPPPVPSKPQLYNPNRQPYHNRRTRRKRCSFCCCFFWTALIILSLALIIAIACTAFWVIYRPHYPAFTVSNFRISSLNLTSPTSDSTHISSSMNLTLTTSNRNKKITFLYNNFDLTVLSESNVRISNGSVLGFVSEPKNVKSVKLELKRVGDLDVEEGKGLKADLKKKSVAMKVGVETKVRVKIGKIESRRLRIRVTCVGIKGSVPSGKAVTVASTGDAKCEVDLRFKIWRFTF